MTKEEKIKEAYGNHYNFFKHFVDENGWLDKLKISQENLMLIVQLTNDISCESKTNESHSIRPKSLSGIEDNNGWHCLSEKDFPEDELTVLWYSDKTNEFENASLLHCDFNFEEYTHWHELPTKSPIY